MKRKLFKLVFPAMLFCGLGTARAEGITFTFDATGSGYLGGVGFNDAGLTITITSDTMNIVNCGSGVFSLDSGSADVAVTGFDTVTVLTPTRVFDNNSVSALGFSQASCRGSDFLDIRNDAFASYALEGPFGPIFDPEPFAAGFLVQTTGGTLTVIDAHDVTFNAFTDCGGGAPIPQASVSSLSSNAGPGGFISGVRHSVAE
jgi:hypothetical protein